jgi:4-hydroxybenzoate polyprenyltransferase
MVGVFCSVCGYALSWSHGSKNSTPNLDATLVLRGIDNGMLFAAGLYFLSLYIFIYVREFSLESPALNGAASEDERVAEHNRLKAPKQGVLIIVAVAVLGIVFGSILATFELVTKATAYFIAAIVPMAYLLFRTGRQLNDESTRDSSALAFSNRILFPAMTTCMSSFLFGWFVNFQNQFSWIIFLCTSMVYCGIIYWSGRSKSETGSSVLCFGVLLIAAPVLTVVFDWDDGAFVGILLAVFISLALGVTEVTNRLPFIAGGDTSYRLAKGETLEFYISGANWSPFVFIPFVPLLGLFLPNLPVWILYVYTLFFLIVWINAKDKTDKKFRIFSMAFGFALPIIIIFGLLLGSKYPNSILLLSSIVYSASGAEAEIISLSDRITTILGVFLTVIFVLLQSDYKELMDSTLRARNSANDEYAFLVKKNCMLLFFVVASFVSIYALFVTSILSKAYDSQSFVFAQVDEFQIFSLVLIAVVLVFYVWRDDEQDDDDQSDEATKSIGGNGNGVRTKTIAKKQKSSNRVLEEDGNSILTRSALRMADYLTISRAFASSLAGLAVVVALQVYANFDITVIMASGLSIFFVTMFGFVINDIYDFEKDRRGGRYDKVLLKGRLTHREVRLVALVWLLCSWAVSLSLLNTSSFLLLVTLSIALTVYSPFSKAVPVLKGFYTAVLCMSPALFLNVVAGEQIIGTGFLLIGLAYFVGREVIIDAGDRAADILSGTRTLAVVLGQRWSIALGTIIMMGSLSILYWMVEGNARSVVLLGLAFTLAVGYIVNRDVRLSVALTRIPLAVGVIAVLSS